MKLAWFTQNDITTGETRAYPELAPHDYPQPPDRVYEVMAGAARSLHRWTVVQRDPVQRRIHVEVKTAMFNFTDDLTAWVEEAGDASRVMIRSHSRVGRGDLGENARHIAALQKAMDEALGKR